MSVKSILNIKCCTLPFAGIILGPASSLKTVVIELFRECHHTFYTDNFSAKAFVSQNPAVKKEKLKEIDMLPRIKNKFFLTPELAPTFAQREEELIQTLGIMTRILDGHGYESDTGAQGIEDTTKISCSHGWGALLSIFLIRYIDSYQYSGTETIFLQATEIRGIRRLLLR